MIANLPQYEYQIDDTREIRVFISSTFRDMQEERTELFKLFTRLRTLASERGVSIAMVDLRWGITKEESRDGKVVEICLDEILRSRPFFIGLLGHRYGWCPELKEIGTLVDGNKYPWLIQDVKNGLSVTEIEMQFGVLRNPEPIEASFYIKEGSNNDENDPNSSKLQRLRMQVESQNRYPARHYKDVKQLVEMVESAFIKMLDKSFPIKSFNADGLMEIREQQERFHLLSNNIVDDEHDRKLMEFLESGHPVMKVTGMCGIGKSALLAHWSDVLNVYNPIDRVVVVYHRVDDSSGISPSRLASMFARKLKTALRARGFDEDAKLLDKDKKNSSNAGFINKLSLFGLNNGGLLKSMFGGNVSDNVKEIEEDAVEINSLGELSAAISNMKNTTPFFIIDDIDKVVDSDNALRAFMTTVPSNMAIVVSCQEDTKFHLDDSFKLELQGLPHDTTRLIVDSILQRNSKNLSDGDKNEICNWQLSLYPKALEGMMMEMVRHGDFDTLDELKKSYLDCENLSSLYEKILTRMDGDYGIEQIRSMLLALSVTRQGLTEDEIKVISGSSQLMWSQIRSEFATWLYSGLGQYRVDDNNMREIIFKHYGSNPSDIDNIRNSIIKAFFPNGKIEVDLRMGDYNFRQQKFTYKDIYRHIVEAIWQYINLNAIPSLSKCLQNPEVFEVMFRSDKTLLKNAWNIVMSSPDGIKPECYVTIDINHIDYHLRPVVLNDISRFVGGDLGLGDLAVKIGSRLGNQKMPKIAQSVLIMNQGVRLAREEKYDEACAQFEKALDMQYRIFPVPEIEIANTLRNLSYAHYYADRDSEARDCAIKAYEIYSKRSDSESCNDRRSCASIIANASKYLEDWATAVKFYPESIKNYEITKGRLASATLRNQRLYGDVLYNNGNREESFIQLNLSLRLALEANNSEEEEKVHSSLQTLCEQMGRDAKKAGNESEKNAFFNESFLHDYFANKDESALVKRNIRYEAVRSETIHSWLSTKRYEDVLRVIDTIPTLKVEATADDEYAEGVAAALTNNYERARNAFANEYCMRKLDGLSSDLIMAATNLAIMYSVLGDNRESLSLLNEALGWEIQLNGPDSANAAALYDKISSLTTK